jgi:hypothetical protein
MSPLGTNMSPLGTNCIEETGHFGCHLVTWLLHDIDDPDYFLQSRNFSIEQEVFNILELTALLNDTNICLIN